MSIPGNNQRLKMGSPEIDQVIAKSFCDLAVLLVQYDEVERALLILNNLPAYYRDHEPKSVTDLKAAIQSKIMLPQDYATHATDDQQLIDRDDIIHILSRGQILMNEIKTANDNGVTPHIVEVGPGNYWLPLNLSKAGHKFTYSAIGVVPDLHIEFKKQLPVEHQVQHKESPVFFVAYEVIEHLHNVDELSIIASRIPNLSKIFLSTPKYTYKLNDDWYEGLQHLRAYTPNEFLTEAQRLFKSAKTWQYLDDQPMTVVGSI